jgi:hypothetical protein
VSTFDFAVKEAAAIVWGPGLVSPAIVTDTAPLELKAQRAFNVTITWPEEPAPVAPVHVPDAPTPATVTVGVPGMVTLVGKAKVNVLAPATMAVVLEKATVHVEVAREAVEPGVNTGVPSVAALAIVAVPRSTMAMTMAPAVNLFMRWMGLKPDESSCPTTE